MEQTVQFKLPVYKDQGTLANTGIKIAPSDTLRVVTKNGATPSTTIDIVVTAVGLNGKLISWNPGTTGLRPNDIEAVHARHTYTPQLDASYFINLVELSPGSVLAKVTSISLDGVTYPINVEEVGPAANGITPAFQAALLAAVNGIIGSLKGSATVEVTGTAGSQTLRLGLSSMDRRPTAIAVAGLTPGTWTKI